VKSLDFGRHTLYVGVAAVLLAGCGGPQPPIGEPGAMAQSSGMMARTHRASGPSGDLLYVGHPTESGQDMVVLTFPSGEPVASISGIGKVLNLCSDTSGNVWAVTENYPGDFLYKFSHGGTSPIAKLTGAEISWACSVDPRTGDVAAATYGFDITPYIYIWRAYSGGYSSPTILSTTFDPWVLTYDPNGNLFVGAGVKGSSGQSEFALEELPYGKSKFKQLVLNKPALWPSGLQWDGQYVALYTGGPGMRARIYQLRIARSKVTVVKTLHFAEMLKRPPNIWIAGNNILSITRPIDKQVEIGYWRYPEGGKPYETLRGYAGSPLALSVAPSRSRVHR
jgi:hypothetical protein